MTSKTLLLSLLFSCTFIIVKAQTTTIDFNHPLYYYYHLQPYVWDPHYFDNSGCKTYHNFGPNPTPLSGHNVRVIGATYIGVYDLDLPRLNLLAWGKTGGSYVNSVISIEYPFQANKTYEIEINGFLDYLADLTPQHGDRDNNAVFWFKLDNDPEIASTAINKCEASLTPVEKKVDRYSKLIADSNLDPNGRYYRVRFSTLESKNALKIIHDPSPADPKISFNKAFRLNTVKIKEMPYEEDQPSYAFYTNTKGDKLGSNTRNNPVYQIEYIRPTNPQVPGTHPTRPTTISFNIAPDKWFQNPDGTYSVHLDQMVPIIANVDVKSVIVIGDLLPTIPDNPRPTRPGEREKISLPGSFQGSNLTVEKKNFGSFLTSNNLPSNTLNIELSY